ncbi:porin [Thalassotalea piscium]|uniref:Putative porin n=1 Tax=Thalassotalea piscium TaxID=1230533 RepID=A0A7X0TU03_9GAMM|nr:porin [Thalassotalea piscium]MBB6543600.1 putative porin [Thalassotalea piscium]
MKRSKRIISTAILSALSLNVAAADVSFYGKANVSVQSSDDGQGSYSEMKSNASRIGFKGTHTLSNELEVIYQAEFQVDLDGDGDTFSQRNQYIGLEGSFGQVLFGKNDTVFKQAQGKIDLFNDLNGDIKVLWKGENRMSDSITYKSPSFSGVQLAFTYVLEDSLDKDDAYSVAVSYGDKNLKKANVYAAIAIDSEMKGYDAVRATIQGKVAGFTLGAMAQSQEKVDGSAEMTGYLVSAKYGMYNWTFKGQLQAADHDGGDDNSGISIGADYTLSKSTKLYSFYTTYDMDSNSDQDYLGLGIDYKF